MHGRPRASILSERTVRASPIQRKPTCSAKRLSASAASVPKQRLYSPARLIAPETPRPRPSPSSSLTSRVTAKRIRLLRRWSPAAPRSSPADTGLCPPRLCARPDSPGSHGDAAHEQRGRRHKRRVHNKPPAHRAPPRSSFGSPGPRSSLCPRCGFHVLPSNLTPPPSLPSKPLSRFPAPRRAPAFPGAGRGPGPPARRAGRS